MPVSITGPLHAYLAGTGLDGRGRLARDVLGLSDEQLEEVHDYIQWLFPLPTRSAAQPGAPVLTQAEIDGIKGDPQAVDTLRQGAQRMLQFYRDTTWWLNWQDHNHLRITRIIHSLGLLVGSEDASQFYGTVLALHASAGPSINPRSLRFWAEAAGR